MQSPNMQQSILSMAPGWIQSSVRVNDEMIFYVSPAHLLPFLTFLRNHSNTQFEQLIDACGVDYPDRPEGRFEMVYQLLSMTYETRIRVKVITDEFTPIPSISALYQSAGWLEREAWDMFGIFFSDHPDLRRILTDYGFEGHPLRKDFPLTGYTEVQYNDTEKRVTIEPVQMTQEYRYFNFVSPWDESTRTPEIPEDIVEEIPAIPVRTPSRLDELTTEELKAELWQEFDRIMAEKQRAQMG